MDIGAWLRGVGLERYEQAFRDNEIDARSLPYLTTEDLRELGVIAIGHRRLLLRAIADLETPDGSAEIEGASRPPAPEPTKPSARAFQAERRQLTVMFVDLVASTALAAKLDPEDMRDIIRSYQNTVAGEITRLRGHVAKYMGDGVLAYFGYPQAHEDGTECAVRAGLAVVTAVGRLRAPTGEALVARVGIATGLVVVGDLVGEGATQEEAVVGETPNLAARLQALAAPGEVVIAASTRQLLGKAFELIERAPEAVKGLAEPVATFAVRGESTHETRFEARSGPGLLPMVGRDQELALLLERWAQAKAAEGQAVLLTGEAGIGKSRIVRALLDTVAAESHTRVRYQCSPFHRNSALWPVIQQLNRAATIVAEDPIDAKLDKLEAMLAEADHGEGVAPLIADLLGLDGQARYGPLGLTPQAKRARTLEALVGQLLSLAGRQPVLVVLEDAHWTDPTTLELIEQCLDRVAAARVLILLTSRLDQQPMLAARAHLTRLSLNRLARRGVEAIVTQLGGDRLPAKAIDTILYRADGVPLFVEELSKAVAESGDTAVPASLHDSLMARLDRLPAAKEVAQIAACIGREFDYRLLAAVADRPEPDLTAALDQLASAELIFRRGTSPEAKYAFKHVLIRDAAYESMLKEKRRALHGRIADTLEGEFSAVAATEPELVARHYASAGLDQQALGWWARAGEQATRRSSFAEARAHVEMGLALVARISPSPERLLREIELQARLGTILIAQKGQAAAEVQGAFARAEELCLDVSDPSKVYPVLQGLWHFHSVRAELAKAREIALRCDEIAKQDDDPAHRLAAQIGLSGSCWFAGDFPGAENHFRLALGMETSAPRRSPSYAISADIRVFMRGFGYYAMWHRGKVDAARDLSEEALRLAEDSRDPYTLVMALDHAAMLRQFGHDVPRARELASTSMHSCSEYRFPYYGARAMLIHGWARSLNGEPEEGVAEMRQGLTDLEATGCRLRRPFHLSLLAEVLILIGRPDEASLSLAEAKSLAEATGERWRDAELQRLEGRLLLAASHPRADEAERRFETALGVARNQDARALELRAAIDLARLWANHGERQKALDLLAPIYGWCSEGFDTADLKDAKALLDELA